MRTRSLALQLLLLPAFCASQPVQKDYYVLAFSLTPNDNGRVEKCELADVTHFGPSYNQRQDHVNFQPSAITLKVACESFKNTALEVHRDAAGYIQAVFARWPCYVSADQPDKPDCKLPEQIPTD